MVEVDVAEQEMAHIRQPEPELCQSSLELGDAGGRPAVEERRAVLRFEEVRPDDALGAAVTEVD
jgi:hypothetical protein